MKTLDNKVTVGINVNCKDNDYVDWMLNILKTIETRNCRSLDKFIGKRVGLIETGKGRARLRGYATITGVYVYDTKEMFDEHSYMHRIYPGDKYYWNGNKKYGYILEDVVSCEPRYIYTNNCRVWRKI